MSKLEPLIFKSYDDYYNYISSLVKEDGYYTVFVIFNNFNDIGKPTALLHEIYFKDHHIDSNDWIWDICARDGKFSCYIGNLSTSSEDFFDTLKEDYPEYFQWFLFNPNWHILGS